MDSGVAGYGWIKKFLMGHLYKEEVWVHSCPQAAIDV